MSQDDKFALPKGNKNIKRICNRAWQLDAVRHLQQSRSLRRDCIVVNLDLNRDAPCAQGGDHDLLDVGPAIHAACTEVDVDLTGWVITCICGGG